MKITIKDVEHVALLSRLAINEREKEEHLQELDKILQHMDILNQVDTSDVEPLAHVLPINNVLREDELGATLPKDKVLQNAPDEDGGMFKIPKIV